MACSSLHLKSDYFELFVGNSWISFLWDKLLEVYRIPLVESYFSDSS